VVERSSESEFLISGLRADARTVSKKENEKGWSVGGWVGAVIRSYRNDADWCAVFAAGDAAASPFVSR
jgi:hypothetical protein